MAQKSRKDFHHLNSGEWSPKVNHRIDLQKHSSALELGRNVHALPQGPVLKRKGSLFVAPCKFADKEVNPIKFQFSRDDALCIEMGDQYMRFHARNEQVREGFRVVSSITAANPAVVTSNSHGYSDGDEVYIRSLNEMTELNGRWFIVAGSTTNTFQLTERDGSNVDASIYTAESTGGTVEKVYEITAPFTSDEVHEVDYVQKDDVIWLVHKNHPVQKLTRLGTLNWAIADATYEFAPMRDPNTEEGQTLAYTGTLTEGSSGSLDAVGHDPFTENHIDSYWELRHLLEGATFDVYTNNDSTGVVNGNNISNNAGLVGDAWAFETSGNWEGTFRVHQSKGRNTDLSSYDSSEWDIIGEYNSPATSVNDGAKNFLVTGSVEPNAPRYVFVDFLSSNGTSYDDRGQLRVESAVIVGVVQVTDVTDEDTATVTVIKNILRAEATEDWSEGAFSDARGHPQAVAFFEERLWFAGARSEPQKIYGSELRTFDSYFVGTNDDAGIAISLSSQERNEILWMTDQNVLMIGTTGGEWVVSGTELNSIITPTNVVARRQETNGSSRIRPLLVNEKVFFVQAGGRKIRDFGYDLERDRLHGVDALLFSEHLSKSGIKKLAYQSNPEPVLYALNNNGEILALAYERDQDVNGWTLMQMSGTIVGMETIYGTTPYGSSDDELWVVVEHEVNGSTVRYMERIRGYYDADRIETFGQASVQVAIVLDTSSGMQTIIDNLVADVLTMNTALSAVYSSVEFALYEYKEFTPTATDFTTAAAVSTKLDGITASGGLIGDEPAYFALQFMARDLSWDSTKEHITILATTEGSSQLLTTAQDAIDALDGIRSKLYYGPNQDADHDAVVAGVGGGNWAEINDIIPFVTGIDSYDPAQIEKIFVDAALVRVGSSSTTTIDGLWHLEGEAVNVLADGRFIRDLTVTNGAITLDDAATIVHIGLAYTARIKPLSMDADGTVGSTQGYYKNATKGYVWLLNSLGLKTNINGATDDRELPFTEMDAEQDEPPALFTGLKEIDHIKGTTQELELELVHDYPFPLSVAGIVIHYNITSE